MKEKRKEQRQEKIEGQDQGVVDFSSQRQIQKMKGLNK